MMNRDDIEHLISKYDLLYENYKNQGNGLIKEFEGNKRNYRVEYSKGGEVIHRGFYSPSMADVYCGGCRRGKILKRLSRVPNYDYEYYFDLQNRLVCCKQFTNEFKKNDLDCMSIEFLLYEHSRVLSLRYEYGFMNGLELISESQYDNVTNTIIRYEAVFFPLYTKDAKEIDVERCSYVDNKVSEIQWTHYFTLAKAFTEDRYRVLYENEKRPTVDLIARQTVYMEGENAI